MAADRAYRRVERAFARYSDTTLELLKSLGENCFFSYSAATTSPFEFEQGVEGRELARAIAGAVARGAICLYIRPNKMGVDFYEKAWGYGRVVQQDVAKKEFDDFRRYVRDYLKGDPMALSGGTHKAEEAHRMVYERLAQCYITSSPMWMPGIGLGIVGWADPSELKARITMSLPGGKFGGVIAFPQQSALEFRFARVLGVVVSGACAELESATNERSSMRQNSIQHIEIETELEDNEREWVKRFYHQFQKLLRPIASGQPHPDILGGVFSS